jgi:CHAT domain-containing protein/tetratricopeptide (TPR) repeat protein
MTARAAGAIVPALLSALALIGSGTGAAPATDKEPARALIDQGRYAEAEALARDALRDLAAAGKASTLEAAEALDLLVETLWRRGRVADDEALEAARQAAEITEKALGPGDGRVAAVLRNLGRVLELKGRYREAREVAERAFRICEHAPDASPIERARTRDALADILLSLEEPAEASRLYLEAIDLTTAALGPGHPDNAEYLRNLGQILRDAGNYEEALKRLERALAIASDALGANHPRLVWFLNSLGGLHDRLGNYTEAKRLYERGLAIAREGSPVPDHRLARCLNNLGHLLANMGDYEGATARYEEALRITEQVQGRRHPDVALTLASLAGVARLAGKRDEAEGLLHTALDISQEVFGTEHTAGADILLDLAGLAREKGDYSEALKLNQKALDIWARTAGRAHFDYALGIQGQAGTFEAEGRQDEAAAHYRDALAILEKTYGKEHPACAAGQHDLARTLARMRLRPEALDAALKAESVARNHQRLLTGTLVDREALRFAEVRTHGLDVALSLSAEGLAPDQNRRVWDALIRSRTLVLDEMTKRHREAQATPGDENARLRSSLVRASRRLANLMMAGPGEADAQFRDHLEAARREKEKIEIDLAAKSRDLGQDRAERDLGLEDVEAHLPEGSALVAYAVYRRPPPPGKSSEPVESYLAFLLRRGDRRPRAVSLGSAREIDDLVHRFRVEVTRTPSGGTTAAQAERACRREGEALRRKVWDPLAPALKSASRVFIVPDGTLSLVNFYALPAGDADYLIDRGVSIHYLSSERDLVPDETRGPRGRGLLALGGPAFDAAVSAGPADRAPTSGLRGFSTFRPACADVRGLRFDPLPGSDLEAGHVVELWRSTAAPAPEPALHLSGPEASEPAFKREAPGKRILHLATHGFFTGACAATANRQRGIGGLAPAQPPGAGAGVSESPLLLSGLALAGANRRDAAGPEEEDGILTAEEIAVMDLSGVRWAVLSACDTGLGTATAGEGVLGLRRAFRIAGVESVVMSLWAVEDASARKWIEALYTASWLEGNDTVEAVRRASVQALDRSRRAAGHGHPFYWAAFVAAGNWR